VDRARMARIEAASSGPTSSTAGSSSGRSSTARKVPRARARHLHQQLLRPADRRHGVHARIDEGRTSFRLTTPSGSSLDYTDAEDAPGRGSPQGNTRKSSS
jgi:hypothetical protein